MDSLERCLACEGSLDIVDGLASKYGGNLPPAILQLQDDAFRHDVDRE